MAAIDLVERHREVILEGEQAARVVQAFLRGSPSDEARQGLLEAYGHTPRGERLDGMNVLLVVNAQGRIVYASRPAWRRLVITDPLLSRTETNDADFSRVVDCFRHRQPDCMQIRSADLALRTGSFTVVRPVQQPPRDLGLPREPFLVIAIFDTGVVLVDFTHDIVVLLVISLVLGAALTAALWYVLAAHLLPRLNQAAQIDGLTQLSNRTSFMETAMEVLAEAEQRGAELVFAILDIDHFKTINDTYGHDCGDVSLVSVAAVLATVLRPDDCLCRFGGEEFALLLSTSKDGGRKVLERLRLQLEMNRVGYRGHQLPITVSVGAAATADCGYNLDYLYTAADKALYAAKNGGRNRVEFTDAGSLSRLQLTR
ncbi:MAG: GGDEF domain-containing protein [Cyanobacteriota bacterium]|nr:GGDEF domain-containing protein [Cyanobacteriota bacterium]